MASEKGLEGMAADSLGPLVDKAIAENGGAWARFCAGEGKAMGALVGAVMKLSQGKADGKAVTALLNSRRP
jgi:aspartyl-tRNA(Asn)/glutamyl-tRNA(Gln) amidotransferase subunit B